MFGLKGERFISGESIAPGLYAPTMKPSSYMGKDQMKRPSKVDFSYIVEKQVQKEVKQD